MNKYAIKIRVRSISIKGKQECLSCTHKWKKKRINLVLCYMSCNQVDAQMNFVLFSIAIFHLFLEMIEYKLPTDPGYYSQILNYLSALIQLCIDMHNQIHVPIMTLVIPSFFFQLVEIFANGRADEYFYASLYAGLYYESQVCNCEAFLLQSTFVPLIGCLYNQRYHIKETSSPAKP